MKSGALVQDAATGAWSKGNAELKRLQAEAKANAAASQLLADRAADEAARTQALTDAYRAQGLEYDARTGAVKRATEASTEMGAAMSREEQLARQGIEVLEWRNDLLWKVSGSVDAAAGAQARLSEAIQKAASTDAESYANALGAIRAKQSEMINLADSEAVRRRTLAQELGGDLTRIEEEIAANKARVLSQIQGEYQRHIASLNAAARSHLDEVRRIEDEIAALKLSTEDRLRALQQQGMTDYQKYQDQQAQIAEKGAAARQALLDGEFQKAAELYEEQAALAERAARRVTDGDKEIVSQQKAVQTAYNQVAEAMSGKEQALQAQADSSKARAEAANEALKHTESLAAGVADQIAGLDGDNTVSTHTVESNVDDILRELAKLDGNNTSSTHTVYQRTVKQSATGGLIGAAHFAAGERGARLPGAALVDGARHGQHRQRAGLAGAPALLCCARPRAATTGARCSISSVALPPADGCRRC
ncbi:MAG: hypothetical protein MZV65_43715 [Chromatiales bacterium]|nr:hypothetical protein [Chromatiales bacterium]